MPPKDRAFDTRRHVGHILEDGGFFEWLEVIAFDISFDHLEEEVCEAECLVFFLSDDQVQHHICGSLGDGAAIPDERPVNDLIVFNF